jgi:hypothetical protein
LKKYAEFAIGRLGKHSVLRSEKVKISREKATHHPDFRESLLTLKVK